MQYLKWITQVSYRACARPSLITDYVSSLPPADAPPLSGDAGRRELNLSQYVNTVMQLLCKEICEEKALPERRDYPAGGLKG